MNDDLKCSACGKPADLALTFTVHAVSAVGERMIERFGPLPQKPIGFCSACSENAADFVLERLDED